jgi:rhodanese-related sulfurtransferase
MKPRMFKLTGLAAFIASVAVGVVTFTTRTSAFGPWTLDPRDQRVTMEDVEREVIRRYQVPDVTPATVAAMLTRSGLTLFDVRTAEEFETGRLPGAIRIEPGTPASEILRLHRDKLEEGQVVFYCAVGVRSSRLMLKTLHQLAPHATNGIYNLRGGVFRWTADGRPLVKGAEFGKAHPFDDRWGQLLARIKRQ